jgi:hypothetical protein
MHNDTSNFEKLFSAKEAALYLRIHVKTLQRLAREGRMSAGVKIDHIAPR